MDPSAAPVSAGAKAGNLGDTDCGNLGRNAGGHNAAVSNAYEVTGAKAAGMGRMDHHSL